MGKKRKELMGQLLDRLAVLADIHTDRLGELADAVEQLAATVYATRDNVGAQQRSTDMLENKVGRVDDQYCDLANRVTALEERRVLGLREAREQVRDCVNWATGQMNEIRASLDEALEGTVGRQDKLAELEMTVCVLSNRLDDLSAQNVTPDEKQ